MKNVRKMMLRKKKEEIKMRNVQKMKLQKKKMDNAFGNPIEDAIEKELKKWEILKDAKFLDWVFSEDRYYYPFIDLKKEDINEEEADNISKLVTFLLMVFDYAEMNEIKTPVDFSRLPSLRCYYYLKYNNNYYAIGREYLKRSKLCIFCYRIDDIAKDKEYIEFTDIQKKNNKTTWAENQNVTNLVKLIFSLAKRENIPIEIIKEAADKAIEAVKVAK